MWIFPCKVKIEWIKARKHNSLNHDNRETSFSLALAIIQSAILMRSSSNFKYVFSFFLICVKVYLEDKILWIELSGTNWGDEQFTFLFVNRMLRFVQLLYSTAIFRWPFFKLSHPSHSCKIFVLIYLYCYRGFITKLLSKEQQPALDFFVVKTWKKNEELLVLKVSRHCK